MGKVVLSRFLFYCYYMFIFSSFMVSIGSSRWASVPSVKSLACCDSWCAFRASYNRLFYFQKWSDRFFWGVTSFFQTPIT